MKKVDFRKIEVPNIEGGFDVADVSKQLGNLLYMQGRNVEECELGWNIYHNGEVELTEKQAETIKKYVQPWAWIIKRAIENAVESPAVGGGKPAWLK